jgi:aspartate/methionine/tyrosine aminotransferase
VVTISPNNPTGAVYSPTALREVNEICRRHGVYHIHDEAYEYFVYGAARHFSPGSIPASVDYMISLYSLSKAYGFAAWRIGYMVIPERLLPAVKKAQDTILICPPVVSQEAACGALQAGAAYCRPKIQALARVRQMVLDELWAIKSFCAVPPADGAFYFLVKIDTQLDPMTVVERLIRDFGVAVIPGSTFGVEQGCTLRIAYGALEADSVAEGIGRLVRGLKAIVGG